MTLLNIIESLRRGEVPNTQVESILVDREEIVVALDEDLVYLQLEGSFKTRYLNGNFGSGKTFILKILENRALKKNFAVSSVVLNEKNARFDKLENIYQSIISNLQIDGFQRGSLSLSEIISRWCSNYFGSDIHGIKKDVYKLTPSDPYLGSILLSYYTKPELRLQILSWLMRENTVTASDKKGFGVRGEIERSTCLNYLHGIGKLIKESGFTGWVIIFDEVESILRLQTQHKLASLENIRLLDDNQSASLVNSELIFAGTNEFFTSGIRSYKALESRIQSLSDLNSYRQPMLKLNPLEKEDRRKLLINIKQVYEKAYNISLSIIDDNIIEEIDNMSMQKNLTVRDIVKRLVAYFDVVATQGCLSKPKT